MATARKTTKTVTQEVTTCTLELSEDEATALRQYFEDGAAHGADGPLLLDEIYDALKRRPETTQPAPLAVGDRVRVTEFDFDYNGRVGTLERIDLADAVLPHMVRFDDGDSWWTKGVERV